jgi:hypothetical protein
MTKPLFKTTIVIWSDFSQKTYPIDLSALRRGAAVGEAYCSKLEIHRVITPEADDDWDGTEFFNED